MAKYLSGRVQRIPQSGLTSDRYSYLSLDQAEPNLGDPAVPGVTLPVGVQYQMVSVLNYPGERYWIPVGGGLIPGSISVYNEGLLVPPGGVSSITQLNFVGAAISASGYLDSYGNPGTISTITVFAPGNNKELIFNSNNEFSSSVDLTYDTNTGILTAGRRLNVGVGGTVISTTGIGSVGIGTTNPTAKLHIVGDLRLSGTIYDYLNNPGSTQQLLVKNTLGSLVWTSQGSIKAGAGGTFNQVQYHNSAGLVDGAVNFVYDPINNRVGIGSTLPTYLLDVTGDTRITGIATLNKLYVTGISTFSSSVDSTNSTSGALIISGGVGIVKNLNVGAAVSAVSLTVTGQTTTQNLNVVGVSTLFDINGTSANFSGIVTASTFKGQISSGVGTITTFNSTTGTISALTGTSVTYTNGNITTLNGSNAYYNAGIITTLTSTNSTLANIISSGISTLGITTTTQLTARSLNVSGITTTQTLNVSSTSTFGGSITPSATTSYNIGSINYKWNSLYVSTIVADTITGNTTTATSVIGGIADITSSNVSGISTTQSLIVTGNSSLGIATATSLSSQSLSVAGVATVPTLNSTSGNITTLNGSNLYYNIGIITALTGTAATITTGNIATLSGSNAYYNVGVVTTLSGTSLTYPIGNITSLISQSINVTGVITATTFKGALNGNTDTATKLATGRTIAITGDLAYTSPSFDGTTNVTATGTLANTGVTASTYGSSTQIPVFAVDSKGRVTSVTNTSISFGAATVAQADKLTNGRTIAITGDLAYTSPSFDGTANITATSTLASTGVVANTYGSTTTIPQIAVDAKGRITSASSVGVNFTAATVAQADKLTNGRTIAITGDLAYTSPSFDGTANITATSTLASTGVSANTYGSGSQVPVFAVDSKGRITSVTNTSITGINASSVAAAGSNTQIQFNDSNVFAGNANLTFNKATNTFATSAITANSITIAGDGSALYGPNSTWAQYLRVGGNGNADTTNASVVTTNGNLHLDAKTGAFATYINYYKGTGGVNFGNGASATVGSVDSSGNSSFRTIASTVATGTAPLTIASTTQVSNLNVSYLQGYQVSSSATANTIVLRDGSGDDFRRYGFGSYFNSTDDISAGTITYLMGKFGDNYYRSATAAKVATFISGQTMNISGSSTSCSGNAATASSVVNTVAGTGSIELVRGNMADNDQFRILVGGTATNAGYVEIATADDGTEPIYVRQYTGVFSSLTRTATLLDGSGNTSFPGTVSGTNITSGGNVTGSSASCSGNAATATNLSTGKTNWSTNGTITAVVGQLSWKNYGNSHTIFDASASTSPDGGAVNNTNSQVVWSSTYPTLMGWNGANTYGVRVDVCRLADSATTATNISNAGTVTLASATESNSIYITQPSYTTDQPVKLLNFDWYGNLWSLGNIRSGSTPSNGFGVYSSGTERARFTTSGLQITNSFGVGTAPSGTTGEIRATNNVTAYYSDERLKENIKPITSALSKLLTLRGVTFNSNKLAEQYGYTDKKEQVGVIAQEVEKVLPQIVVPAPFDIAQDKDGNEYSKSGENYKTVHYEKLIPLLIESIKEQNETIENLKIEIEKLKSKVDGK